jgi:hypothetical protein
MNVYHTCLFSFLFHRFDVAKDWTSIPQAELAQFGLQVKKEEEKVQTFKILATF